MTARSELAGRTSSRPSWVLLAALLLGRPSTAVFAEVDPSVAHPPVDGAETPPPPPPNLFQHLTRDFKNVFTTRENLVIAGIGLGAAWGTSHLDERVAASGFNTERNEDGALDLAFEPAVVVGGVAVQMGGAFAAYGLGKLFSKPGVEEMGRDLVRAQIVTQTLTQALKLSVGRERPDGSNTRSFPSGHASGTFATATVLHRRYGAKVGLPAFAVAGYIAGSRVSENRHYLSDVVFGAAIGILVGRTVTVELAGSRFALAPTLAPDGTGAGVQLTWLGPGPGSP